MAIIIEKKLQEAGYKMLGDDEKIEELILDILKSKNDRYLKAIPFLMYKHNINIESLEKKTENLELLKTILDITQLIFTELRISRGIKRRLQRGDSKLEGIYAHRYTPQYKEFKDEFELQLQNDTKPDLLIDTQKIEEERNLQFSLSQLFTKKEKQIIKRLQDGKPISRTDYEYYSRKTKKKIRSIINLEDFARNMYAKNPKYNKELFELKKRLEIMLQKDVVIESFYSNDKEIIMAVSGSKEYDTLKIDKKMIDKNIADLLKKYPEHDFS